MYERSKKVFFVSVFSALLGGCVANSYAEVSSDRLFPEGLPNNAWSDFAASGFSKPVSGVVFTKQNPPQCGVPLGGLGTGCLDIESRGVLGFESVFFPRRNMKPFIMYDCLRNSQLLLPFLGIAVGDKTWVLATDEFIRGGSILGAIDPVVDGNYMSNKKYIADFTTDVPAIKGVQCANDISYWGHYPVADMEYKTSCPVKVGLRAWSPFVLGDAAASAIPGAIFEVHLRNTTAVSQNVALAFSFPGPTEAEAGSSHFVREEVYAPLRGIHVVSLNKRVSYFLGVMDVESVRTGDGLSKAPMAWSEIGRKLPIAPTVTFNGQQISTSSGASASVDVKLEPNQNTVVRFILSWYCPVYEGGAFDEVVVAFERPEQWGVSPYKIPGRENMMGEFYSPMYTTNFSDAVAVAQKLSKEHVTLLRRTLAWQQAIYASKELPNWLRDCLINHLHTLTEDSLWAVAKPPIGDWALTTGSFAMTECPRICSITGCTASDWYGDFPITYFYPELQRSILRLYKADQRQDGAIPFLWASRDVVKPTYDWQIGLNGPCFTSMVHRFWLVTGDDTVLSEFYPAVKKCVIFTMNIKPTPEGVVSVARKGSGQSWWEHTPIYGMVSHLGGIRLAQLRIAQNMAEKVGDIEFAQQCKKWFDQGSKAMESNLWCDETKSYLLFNDPETGKKSRTILSAQLDGDWMCFLEGLKPVFDRERAAVVLKTIKEKCLTDYGMFGLLDYDTPDGVPKPHKYGTFTAEIRMIGMTYMYNGQHDFGLDLIRRLSENMTIKHGMAWDLYCLIMSDTGGRRTGADYYQNLMLWSVPAAMAGQDLAGPTKPGGLVYRILQSTNDSQAKPE